ncbi:MAG: TonB-dependent receptor, partial [Rhodocyclaceae bacterium]|nr:TonB-dependent receptor [Rhodocyclaceae bacterium]
MQNFRSGRRTLACGALFMAAVAARAEEAPRELAPVQVSGEAAGSDLTDLAEPAAQLQGRELARDRAMSLGDTVAKLPGAASSGYGPNAGRPVLRGLDGERVRILNDGAASLDASSMSADHAVAIDPLSAARIELLRGPAALLYGGSAVGGIVNVSDGRIPSDAPRSASGRLGLSYGSAARETAGSAEVETGNGSWALHADAYSRRSEDLDIAGAAVSARLRALAAAGRASVSAQSLAADGHLPGSAANAEGAGFGAAYNTGRGYAGFAYSQQDANYGTVAEPGVSIAMRRERWDLAGEISGLAGFVQALRYKFGHTDYQHVELDAGTPATRFINRGDTGRVEFDHAPLAGFNGVAGLEFGRSNFSALGEEAFLPRSRSASYALFVLEQAKWRGATLSFAARGESAQLDSAGGGPDDPDAAPGTPRFGAARRRDFTPASFAAALEFGPAAARFGLVLSHNERAPSYAELYANGPHAATGTYEVGNPDLPKERSNALEATLRLQSGPYGLKLAAWQNRYRNYLGQIPTGVRRDADGRSSRNGPLTDCGDGTSA